MNLGVHNKKVLITGGDSGIGYETAKILIDEGATIILSDLKQKDVEEAKEKLLAYNSDAKVYARECDLSDNVAVVQFAEWTKKELGGIDILVNSAGARGAAGEFLDLTDEDWQNTIDIDLMGAVRVCRAFIPQMLAQKSGRIILIASENAFQPYVDESPYNACKAAIINLSKCLSRRYGEEGIAVNTVSPAFIETPMTDAMMEDLAEERDTSVKEAVEYFLDNERPFLTAKRRGKPEEVAAVISFLCSEQASYINGSNYRVDSGAVESAFG
ncbi:NAD(P)-dependent dehydrogenase, short-chain alcohol dehydrogenase family [Pustulibacterium marinum]|uniref:NAD(P)-dependent dehydrogenase, short-chain alcohol dehydrogenase family n=1 Tax=Pustulibacterium marinum TaxID=1224947 RepID=A0A1I7G111_9FLAO|nr:SDR family oxidoreductase [Pustulibacterium marinum]SFU42006.1 NAD(P)-dependent dehydrogenase, short-chain alcohol dehydrogenase family [Pustulibacterium marinum]